MWEMVVSGGPVMAPLLICSLVALTVVIDRALFWIVLLRRRNPALLDEVMTLCESGDWEAIRRKTAGTRDETVKIIITGILHRDFSMTKAMESAAADQVKRMRRYMGVLDTMITVAPLLGIFGTVTGIIQSFEALGAVGAERPSPPPGWRSRSSRSSPTTSSTACVNRRRCASKNMRRASRSSTKSWSGSSSSSKGSVRPAGGRTA